MRTAILLGLALLALPVTAAGRNLAIVGAEDEARDGGPSREEIAEVARYFFDLHLCDDPEDRIDHTLRIALDPEAGDYRWIAEVSAGDQRIGLERLDLHIENLRRQRISLAITRLLLLAGYRRGGRLTIEVHPEHATISVGTGLSTLPGQTGSQVLEPGTYLVTASADGYAPRRAEVVVPLGANALVVIHLAPPKDEGFVGSTPFMIGATTVGLLAALVATGLVYGAIVAGDGSNVPTTFCQSTAPGGCGP